MRERAFGIVLVSVLTLAMCLLTSALAAPLSVEPWQAAVTFALLGFASAAVPIAFAWRVCQLRSTVHAVAVTVYVEAALPTGSEAKQSTQLSLPCCATPASL